jgi:hypothetical protein
MLARILRAGWGAVLLLAPDVPLTVGSATGTRAVRIAERLLGARHLAESLILTFDHDRRPRRWIAGLDGLHAISMLALAALRRDLRRDALMSAASAGVLVGLSKFED